MNDTKQKIATIAGAYAFYRLELSDTVLKAWLRLLAHFDAEQVAKAFDEHLLDPSAGQFVPKPADIVKHLQGTQTDRAALAWSKTLQAIERVGGHQSVAFDDPAIHTAIEDLGGWPAITATTYDELPHLERRFCTAYKAHQKAGTPHPPHLAGHAEIGNRTSGRRVAPPVLIGDPGAAERVRLAGSHSPARIGAQSVAGLLAGIPKKTEETQA